MVRVSRLDGKEFTINALLIETIEEVPDTVITLTTGRKYVVKESIEEIVEQTVTFHQRINGPGVPLPGLALDER